MSAVPQPLHRSTVLLEAARALSRSRDGVLPVVAVDGTYLGVVTSRTVADALADGQHDDRPLDDVVELPSDLDQTATLAAGLEALDSSGTPAVPVLDGADRTVVGWLTERAALRVLRNQPAVTVPAREP